MPYYDEFYHEPSEFEELIWELKESLKESVKEEFIEELESLKRENKNLQDIKRNFNSIKLDYERKERQLEIEKSNMEREVRNARLSELTKDHKVIMHKVGTKWIDMPKCDKCDENRRIYYETPLGKRTFEKCDCDFRKTEYHPEEHIMVEFNIRNGVNAWYELKDKSNREYMSLDRLTTYAKHIYKNEMDYEDIESIYDIFFKTKEECQKYCDWLNEKESNNA